MRKNAVPVHPGLQAGAPDDFERFIKQEGARTLTPLTRAPVQGFVKAAFWGLRFYIIVMLLLVAIGFSRGMH